MGNSLTDEGLKTAEFNLLSFSGLQPSEYEVKKVIVDGFDNHIKTYIFGSEKK